MNRRILRAVLVLSAVLLVAFAKSLAAAPCEPSLRLMQGEGSGAAHVAVLDLPRSLAQLVEERGEELFAAVENELGAGVTITQPESPAARNHLRLRRRDGAPDTRPAGLALRRVNDLTSPCVGYDSPWVVVIGDERASVNYPWPAGTTPAEKQEACPSCPRPPRLEGKTEKDGVWEIWSGGPFLVLRLETKSGENPFRGTAYEPLGDPSRVWKRIPLTAYTLRTIATPPNE